MGVAAAQGRVLSRIAFYQNRRDEIPNQELARELAATNDREGAREVAEGLSNANQAVRSDCLKVLYETGYLRPDLIADHAEDFLRLLGDRNNRLVWGAMIALSTVAGLRSSVIGKHADEIMKVMQKGSVITVDNGVKTLAIVASREPGVKKRILSFLFDHLEKCRSKDVAQRGEKVLVAVEAQNARRFIKILEARLAELTPSQAKRVKKVIAAVRQFSP
jgi:hypothetical protein